MKLTWTRWPEGPPEITRLTCLAAVVMAAMLTSGCGGRTANADSIDPSKVQVEEAPDASIVEVDNPGRFQLATVEQRPAWNELNATGVVQPDVTRTVQVLSLAAGRAIEVRARLGDFVQKGDVLARINSADLAAASADYQKAQADEKLARRQLERAQLLYSHGAMAQKDLEIAEDTENKAQVDVKTSAEHLHVLGADPDHASSIVEVRAPISGVIVEQNLTGGTAVKSVDNSPNLFTIADMSRVWLVCDVYENNLSQVHVGDYAGIRLNAYPNVLLRGRVNNIGEILDPNTRAAKVRLELPNPRNLMRQGMFATATFRSKTQVMRTVAPSTALLRLHDKYWVFVPIGGRRFRRTEVQAGAVQSDGMQELLSGVAPAQQVVANALQFSTEVAQ